jgi:intraflagellar transport protein 46
MNNIGLDDSIENGDNESSVESIREMPFPDKESKNAEDAADVCSLEVSDEIKALFQHINNYEPIDLELETPLKCFIPPYIPAVGEIDPMIKIPRPDGVDDGVGIMRLDEIDELEQSNAAVLELQLKNYQSRTKQSKRFQRAAVPTIKDAENSSQEINEWIQTVEEIHDNEPEVSAVQINDTLVQKLLEHWPQEVCDKLVKSGLGLPCPDIDLNPADYARVLCSLTGIPVRNESLVESVHTMFAMFLELRDKEQKELDFFAN